MDIHHIKYFLAVCDTLNFTRAAEQCAITQPALSRAVQQLEDEVGGLLFRRERSLTHLTDLGRLMKPRFEEILAELDQASREAKRFLTLADAKLTIGVMCTVGPVRLAGLLGEFRKQRPDAELSIVEGVPRALLPMLADGKIDAAIIAEAAPFPASLRADPLYRERFLVGFAAGHRFADMNAVMLAQVDGEAYLDRVNCEQRGHIDEHLAASGAQVAVCYASEREDWIQNMVAGGLGICFIPEFSATVPGLVTRPIIDPEIWRDVCLFTMPGRLSAALDDFLAVVRAHQWPEGRGAPRR